MNAQQTIENWAYLVNGSQREYYRWLLLVGAPYSDIDRRFKPGFDVQMKACYRNSMLGAIYHDLSYVEGYCLFKSIPIALEHAWNITADGTVIDTTANEFKLGGNDYFGVVIPKEFILEAQNSTYLTPLMAYYRNHIKNKQNGRKS